MKLTTIEKREIKNEIKKEKAPRVLNFDKEITLKKNENLTVTQIQDKVKASIKANKEFVSDEHLRFQIRLDNLKKQKLAEIKNSLNKKHNINLTDKFVATVSAHAKNENELVKTIEQIIKLVDPKKITNLKEIKNITPYNVFKAKMDIRKENRKIEKEIESQKITFKQFLMDNPNLTIKNAKKQFEDLNNNINNQTKQDDDITVIKNLFVNVLKDFSDNPEKLFDVFARISNLKNITNGNNTNYNKTIEKITTQSVSILKAFSKI
jgi:hypothetical protein